MISHSVATSRGLGLKQKNCDFSNSMFEDQDFDKIVNWQGCFSNLENSHVDYPVKKKKHGRLTKKSLIAALHEVYFGTYFLPKVHFFFGFRFTFCRFLC